MFQVMIVDDEKAIRENLPALINFEAHGFRVCGTAKNGQDALEKWESCRPDVIFLDVRMPVMDGLTFLGKLQERTRRPFLISSCCRDTVILSTQGRQCAMVSGHT